MTAQPRPTVSIIIINWNGMRWLPKCLDSLLAQTYPAIEIILVDNASDDGSADFVVQQYPTVKLVRNQRNDGFARGNNIGLAHSSGEFLLLLNNDTHVEPDFVERFLPAFGEIPGLGSAQCVLALMDRPHLLDTAGSYWTDSSLLYHYGYRKPVDEAKYSQPFPVFSNKGAALLLKRSIIDEVGLFDDDFWCYYEETDLCHRLWLAGYQCWYYPKTTAYHAVGGTSPHFPNDLVQFHNFKNKLLSFMKNFEAASLVRIVPTFLAINVLLSLLRLVQGRPRHFLAFYKAVGWNVRHLPDTRRKRRQINELRVRRDRDILAQLRRKPSRSYYRHLLHGSLEQYED